MYCVIPLSAIRSVLLISFSERVQLIITQRTIHKKVQLGQDAEGRNHQVCKDTL